MKLIQFVPGLPPLVDGIGDYALQLARRLGEQHSIKTLFVVGDPSWESEPGLHPEFPAVRLRRRDPDAFLAALADCRASCPDEEFALLVHFSPYSYQKRGYPRWLQRALQSARALGSMQMHVLYHELEWTDPTPLKSGFWLAPLQRHLIGRVAGAFEFQYTNTELHRRKLEDGGSGRITLIPNFSTLGEPGTEPSFDQRRREIVVFGRAAQRQWSYEAGSGALQSLCERLEIERIVDIGAPMAGGVRSELGGRPIEQCGRLGAAEVNERIARALGTFMQYPVPLLTKSSVHAVSCAHGTIPFIFDARRPERSCPGLVTGEDFVPVTEDSSRLVLPPLQELCAAIFRNYQERASSAAAETLARRLLPGVHV